MSLFASWIHGNAVRPQWVGDKIHQVRGERWDQSVGDIAFSDVNGLPTGWGAIYQLSSSENIGFGGARDVGPFDPANPFQYTLKGYWFHFPIPTPVIVGDKRATLRRAFVMWTASEGILGVAVHVWDGAVRVAALPVRNSPGGSTGLVVDVTQFELPQAHMITFGIGISIGVSAERDGEITFHSAGIDVEA